MEAYQATFIKAALVTVVIQPDREKVPLITVPRLSRFREVILRFHVRAVIKQVIRILQPSATAVIIQNTYQL